jgi:iron-sulfur cluster assembly protein
MLTLTDNARFAVQDIATRAGLPEEGGLRIVESDSQTGAFELTLVAAPVEGDDVIDAGTAHVYVERATAEILADQKLDAVPSPEGTGFLLAPQDGPDAAADGALR